MPQLTPAQRVARLCANDPSVVDDAELDPVARALFAHQVAGCPDYARFCAQRGVRDVTGWRDVPPMPVDGFRYLRLATFADDRVVARFMTSGTTGRTSDERGVHLFEDLSFYRQAAMTRFRRALLPDRATMRVVSLVPPSETSSLARMCDWVIETFGAAGSTVDPTGECLRHLDEPVLVVGTAFGLASVLAEAPFRLLPGSRIMETGGFKGRAKAVTRAELHAFYARVGVESRWVVGEYGMTELSSQWYDGVAGRASTQPDERVYQPPPWARTRVLDPATLREVRPGGVGLLMHFDPINVGSVQAVLTADLGTRTGSGFVYRGRATGAQVRGCSLLDEARLA